MLFMPFMVECTISVVSFGECHPAVQMLLRDQREDVFEFRKSCFAGIHKGVAASESRDFSHPGSVDLPVQHDFVVVESHGVIIRLSPNRAGADGRNLTVSILSPEYKQTTGNVVDRAIG